MTAARHRWGPKTAFLNKSERVCARCGLVKVTRHDGGATVISWVEYWRDCQRLAYRNTPPCPGARGAGEP
jgi:hypothetical protein